jgi:hypothetical protein
MRRALSALAIPLAAFAVGCGDDEKSDTTGSGGGAATSTTEQTDQAATTETGKPGSKVEITQPKDGDTTSGTVKVKVKLADFQLAPKDVGKANKEGYGHLHFSLDEGKFDKPKYSGENGKLAVKLGVDGKYSPSVTPTITYKGIPKGEHTLEVYLANNDHSDTGVEAKADFTVQ